MSEYDHLDTYNGDAVHNMWVDFDSYENTGTPDILMMTPSGAFIDNLNDCD